MHADEPHCLTGCSYTYCGDGSKNGNATVDCFFNDPVAQKVGSQVRYSTQSNMKNYKTASTGGTYPTEVRPHMLSLQQAEAVCTSRNLRD